MDMSDNARMAGRLRGTLAREEPTAQHVSWRAGRRPPLFHQPADLPPPGAVARNAGCYGGETWNHVATVETADRAGVLRRHVPSDYEIGYRHARLKSGADEWFVSAVFAFEPGDVAASMARIRGLLSKRIT